MDIFQFFRATLGWTASVVALWPLTIPMAFLAFKIGKGTKPLDEDEQAEIWTRSTLGTAAMAVGVVAFVVLDYLLVAWAELPPGPIHMVVLVAFLAYAAWMCMLFFEFEDFFGGLGMFVLYAYLPVTLLWIANLIYPFWMPVLSFVFSWLR